ncbi:dihydroorotase [Chitinophaga horti]|uniref:Dihydroorotase n=1 Tax=Chitinophaga horti TaxID=2920382 RepID=A0ABY6J9E6_9BACT|nr:dihydroorotase [Chitinophaga horti]UYQ94794.1 dihydroorotase [Chitinophaga horti]
MHILLKNVRIVASHSPFNGQQKDILISNGIIQQIGDELSAPEDAQVISSDDLHVSTGWADVFANFCDPGQEYKEDLQSGSRAAAVGGFTTVMVVPNTQPAIQTKPQVEYILSQTRNGLVNVLPIGAISKNLEGSSLAEMYEMRLTGAAAFSDGLKPLQSSGLMLKALQYVKAFNGAVIQVPDDTSISGHGLMHEGIHSTRLGMPGKPAIGEEIMIRRDLELARYTDSHIHFTAISTAKSVELITAAKAEGVKVTCSVTPYHLTFTDADLADYDTNLKVNPPLRSAEDVAALKAAVKNGQIDCFATHHLPQDWDAKQVEFEYAKHGMIGLESAFGALVTALPEVPVAQLAEMLATGGRKVFDLPTPVIEEGAKAELTLFSPSREYTFSEAHIGSKSKNSAYLGRQLKGMALGIINNGKVYLG